MRIAKQLLQLPSENSSLLEAKHSEGARELVGDIEGGSVQMIRERLCGRCTGKDLHPLFDDGAVAAPKIGEKHTGLLGYFGWGDGMNSQRQSRHSSFHPKTSAI